ncbi:MAG: NAD(P)-dependent glycerol-3-phosphate dehydrogenase [Gammaproteobacteria bacterium]|nr:NAD(P)-dependent glycerol-3-phosphate dehydrogenase [Gammaproteobacteria bacterium]
MQHKPIAILGAGAWGTALALYLARLGQIVHLWSIDPAEIKALNQDRMNQRYLPDFAFSAEIKPTDDLATAIHEVDDILIVIPSVGFRHTLELLKPHLKPHHHFICATKGIDAQSGQLLNHVASDILGNEIIFAALSGPSFAKEVAQGLPTAVVLASTDMTYLQQLKNRFTSPIFRTTLSDDLIGVEMGGIGKNVIALAVGMSDGLNLGANARSALLTFGFQEIIRLGVVLGGKEETFTGLSGIGDLILTSLDDLSRNRRFGKALGQGNTVEKAEREIGQAVEGKQNAASLVKLASRHQLRMPLCEMVVAILQSEIEVRPAFAAWFAAIG